MPRSSALALLLVLAVPAGCAFPDDRRAQPVHPDDPFPTFQVVRASVSGDYAGVALEGPAFDVRSSVARRATACATQTLSFSARVLTAEGAELLFQGELRFYEWDGIHGETAIVGGHFFGGVAPAYRPPPLGAALVQLSADDVTRTRSASEIETIPTGRVNEICDADGDCLPRLRLDATLTLRGFNEESELRARADVVLELDLEPATYDPAEDGPPVLIRDARCVP